MVHVRHVFREGNKITNDLTKMILKTSGKKYIYICSHQLKYFRYCTVIKLKEIYLIEFNFGFTPLLYKKKKNKNIHEQNANARENKMQNLR